MNSVRNWGDGGNALVRLHIIGDVNFSDSPNTLDCSCGEHFEAATSSALAGYWVLHGGQSLSLRNVADRTAIGTITHKDDLWKVWAPITARSLYCTCADPDQPSTDCPNFLPGDDRG